MAQVNFFFSMIQFLLFSPVLCDNTNQDGAPPTAAEGMHCTWQTDCPDSTTCCNKPGGGGTCWFAATCDTYCDTDSNCLSGGTCLCTPISTGCTDGRCTYGGDQPSSEDKPVADTRQTDVGGQHCTWASDCS